MLGRKVRALEETMTVAGISELTAELETLAKQYPDKAGELLQKQGRELRKEVIKNVKKSTKTAEGRRHKAVCGSFGSVAALPPGGAWA